MNLRDLPIVRKLGLLLAFNTAIAVLAIATVFSVGTAISRYQGAQEQLDAMANVIGENSRAALAFNDAEGARQVLNALRNKLEIESATLRDAKGEVFAEVIFSNGKRPNATWVEKLTGLVFPSSLQAEHRIEDAAVQVGHLKLRAQLSQIWINLLESLAWMMLIAVALSALAVYFGLRLHHFLTDPNAWFLKTDVPNGLKHFERVPMKNSMDGDFATTRPIFCSR